MSDFSKIFMFFMMTEISTQRDFQISRCNLSTFKQQHRPKIIKTSTRRFQVIHSAFFNVCNNYVICVSDAVKTDELLNGFNDFMDFMASFLGFKISQENNSKTTRYLFPLNLQNVIIHTPFLKSAKPVIARSTAGK